MMKSAKHDGGFLPVYLKSMSLDEHRKPVRRSAPDEEWTALSTCVSVCVFRVVWRQQWEGGALRGSFSSVFSQSCYVEVRF